MSSIFFNVKALGIVGLGCICIGMLARHRTTRDILSVVGGSFLFAYSLYGGDIIFILLQAVFVGVTLFDYINTRIFHNEPD